MDRSRENLYRFHRKRAAKRNNSFATIERAAENLNISDKSLSNWELDISHPDADMIVYMATQYETPGLLSEYCSTVCPIGIARGLSRLQGMDLTIAGIEVVCELKKASNMSHELLEVIRDGKITDHEEMSTMTEVVEWLKSLSNITKEIENNLYISV